MNKSTVKVIILSHSSQSHLTCRTLRDVQKVRTDVLQFSLKLQGPSCLVTVVLLKKQRKNLGTSGEAMYCLHYEPQYRPVASSVGVVRPIVWVWFVIKVQCLPIVVSMG